MNHAEIDQFDAPGSTATARREPFDRFDVQKPNPPGLISTIKRTGANMASTAATAVEDVTGKNPITQGVIGLGQNVEERNPAGIQSLSDIANNPLLTIKEGVGNMVAQMPVTLGASALGAYGGGAVGGAIGGPPGAAGATIGRWAGAAIPTFLQEYGGIRQDQQEAGIDDKARAAGVATANSPIELNPLSPDVKAIRLMAGEEGKKLFGQGGKQVAKAISERRRPSARSPKVRWKSIQNACSNHGGAQKTRFRRRSRNKRQSAPSSGRLAVAPWGPINATASGIRAAKEEEARRVAAQMGVAPIAGAPASPAPLWPGPAPAQPVAGTPAIRYRRQPVRLPRAACGRESIVSCRYRRSGGRGRRGGGK